MDGVTVVHRMMCVKCGKLMVPQNFEEYIMVADVGLGTRRDTNDKIPVNRDVDANSKCYCKSCYDIYSGNVTLENGFKGIFDGLAIADSKVKKAKKE
jgi:hypothetical protein